MAAVTCRAWSSSATRAIDVWSDQGVTSGQVLGKEAGS
jgi:hypothetical protein